MNTKSHAAATAPYAYNCGGRKSDLLLNSNTFTISCRNLSTRESVVSDAVAMRALNLLLDYRIPAYSPSYHGRIYPMSTREGRDSITRRTLFTYQLCKLYLATTYSPPVESWRTENTRLRSCFFIPGSRGLQAQNEDGKPKQEKCVVRELVLHLHVVATTTSNHPCIAHSNMVNGTLCQSNLLLE